MIPKFRAWDKRESVMREVAVLHFTKSGKINFIEYWKNPSELKSYHVRNIDLMQSTGLKGYMDDSFNDYEEKEVYRGDVIDIFWEEYPAGFYQENHIVGVVDLDETGTAWIIKNAKYEYHNPTPIPDEIEGMSISRSLPDEEYLEEIFLHAFNLTADDITILGNIYENPNLLEES